MRPVNSDGAQLSRIEAKLAMEILLQRFETLTLEEPTITWIDSYFAHGPHRQPVWAPAAKY
jgi:cytochrome P450